MGSLDHKLIPPANRLAMFLDFDGTLVPFADTPESVIVPRDLPATLADISTRLDGGLAIVTGRPAKQIDGFLNGAVAAVAGEHGATMRWPNGDVERLDLPNMQSELSAAQNAFEGLDGIWIEQKSAGFAVHYRLAPSQRETVRASMVELSVKRGDLHLLDGNHVFELRATAANKGAAVRSFMQSPPFQGRVPVFVGDDTTDEDAFAAAQDLEGLGIKVGEGKTCARLRVTDCAAVHAFLRDLLA
ncbi:MAG: trehalose-phosphatase [Pseudomonadota bacterium]